MGYNFCQAVVPHSLGNMKDIEGFEGRYAVTEDGRIWRYSAERINKYGGGKYTKQGMFLSPNLSNAGYHRVGLYKNGSYAWFSIHRLVAAAFIPNPNNLPCVNHKNLRKTDNGVNNLEWCTYKENTKHAISNGTHDQYKISLLQVVEIAKEIKEKRTSYRKLALRYGVEHHSISRALRRHGYA